VKNNLQEVLDTAGIGESDFYANIILEALNEK